LSHFAKLDYGALGACAGSGFQAAKATAARPSERQRQKKNVPALLGFWDRADDEFLNRDYGPVYSERLSGSY
jgi:hypothetical protein